MSLTVKYPAFTESFDRDALADLIPRYAQPVVKLRTTTGQSILLPVSRSQAAALIKQTSVGDGGLLRVQSLGNGVLVIEEPRAPARPERTVRPSAKPKGSGKPKGKGKSARKPKAPGGGAKRKAAR